MLLKLCKWIKTLTIVSLKVWANKVCLEGEVHQWRWTEGLYEATEFCWFWGLGVSWAASFALRLKTEVVYLVSSLAVSSLIPQSGDIYSHSSIPQPFLCSRDKSDLDQWSIFSQAVPVAGAQGESDKRTAVFSLCLAIFKKKTTRVGRVDIVSNKSLIDIFSWFCQVSFWVHVYFQHLIASSLKTGERFPCIVAFCTKSRIKWIFVSYCGVEYLHNHPISLFCHWLKNQMTVRSQNKL